MKDEILTHLNDPRQLEKLYRSNKVPFKREFSTLYPEIKGNSLADFWNERLNYESSEISLESSKDLTFVIIASLIAGVIAKFPQLLHLNPELFYQRNIGFIVFPVLTTYFIWKKNLSIKVSLNYNTIFTDTVTSEINKFLMGMSVIRNITITTK